MYPYILSASLECPIWKISTGATWRHVYIQNTNFYFRSWWNLEMWPWSSHQMSGIIWTLNRETCIEMWCWITVNTLRLWVRKVLLVHNCPWEDFFPSVQISAKLPENIQLNFITSYSSVKHCSSVLREDIFVLGWYKLPIPHYLQNHHTILQNYSLRLSYA